MDEKLTFITCKYSQESLKKDKLKEMHGLPNSGD